MEHDAGKKHKHLNTALVAGGALVVLAFVYFSSRGGASSGTPAQTVVGGPNPQEYAAAIQADTARHASDVGYASDVLHSSTALRAAALSTYQQVVPAELQSNYNFELGKETITAHTHDTDVAARVAAEGFASASDLATIQANEAYKLSHDYNAFQASTAVALGQQQKDTILKQSSNQTKSNIFSSILGTVSGFFTNGSFQNPFARSAAPSSNSSFTGPNLTPKALSVGANAPTFDLIPLPQLQLPTGGPYFGTAFP